MEKAAIWTKAQSIVLLRVDSLRRSLQGVVLGVSLVFFIQKTDKAVESNLYIVDPIWTILDKLCIEILRFFKNTPPPLPPYPLKSLGLQL